MSIVTGKLLSLSKFCIELICDTSRLGFYVGFYYLAGALIMISYLKTELTKFIFGLICTVIFSKGLVKSWKRPFSIW